MKYIKNIASVSSRKDGKILNVGLNSTSKVRVLAFVRDSLAHKAKFSIVTPNPELVLLAERDVSLVKSLQKASLAIPDGIGLAQAARFLSLAAPRNPFLRIPVCFIQGLWVGLATFIDRDWLLDFLPVIKGRDLFMELMKLANKKGWRVFFLGGESGEAKVAGEKLRRSLKSARIAYAAGPMLDSEGRPKTLKDKTAEIYSIRQINEFKPHLLFVAFNAPKQEKWLIKWLPNLEIGGGMVVGGTFRYISGQSKLPPKWIESLGLEWAWRLLTEPRRIKRVLRAFPVFPLKVFLYKLNTP